MKAFSLVAALAVLTTASVAAAAEVAPARARTDALIAALKKVPAHAPESALKPIDAFIDTDAIVDDAIGPRAAKFTPAQLADFKKTFHELLRTMGFPNAGEFFRKAQVTFKDGVTTEGDVSRVTLTARSVKDDLESDVTLHWKGPRVVDVSLDGDSLVKDYQNQFAKVVDKEGAASAVAKLHARQKTLKEAAAKKGKAQ